MRKSEQRDGVYKRKDSPYWWASYSDGSGNKTLRSTKTTNKQEALKVRAKWITELWDAEVRGKTADTTLGQVAAMFIQGTAQTKRSSSTDKQRFKPILQFYDVDMIMNRFGSEDVRRYQQHRLLQGVSNNSINKELSLLSTSIKWFNSQFDSALPNPCIGKRLPVEDVEARCLSTAEVKLLVKAARDTELPDNQNKHTRIYLAEFIILGFQTMMRPSEMLELEWDRVNFETKDVLLRVADTKGKQQRLVSLNPEAEAALKRLRRVCDENFPDTRYVFTHTKPRYFGQRIKSVSKVFQLAVERAGIDHATPHALRHSSVTEAVHVGDGSNVVDISKFAGHKDLKTTMRYAHTSGERLHQVVIGLPSVV